MYCMTQMIQSRSTPVLFILLPSLLWIGFKLIDVIVWITYCDLNLTKILDFQQVKVFWNLFLSAFFVDVLDLDSICSKNLLIENKKTGKVFDFRKCYKKSSQIVMIKSWAAVKQKWMGCFSRKKKHLLSPSSRLTVISKNYLVLRILFVNISFIQ